MTEVRIVNEHRCERCGKVFANLMRLQHHIAAEHTPRTLRNIRTTRDIPRTIQSQSNPACPE